MCGIYYSNNIKKENSLKGFESIKHRGPDYSNYIYNNGEFYGFHRLSITGEAIQPFNLNNNISLINGEFYEHKKIAKDCMFLNQLKTNTDSEILLHLYNKFKLNMFNFLNGEFCFIIKDNKTNEIIFARDRFGIKPLYFKRINEQIIIASEMKAIKESGVKTYLNEESLSFALNFQYLNPGETLLNIEECIPGMVYIYNLKNGKLRSESYYDLKFNRRENNNCKEIIEEKLINAIRKRIDTEKTYTTYLSGGIDSSLITSISKDINNNLKESFNINFINNGEKEFAKIITDYKDLNLNSFLYTEEEIINSIEDSVYYSEGLSINSHMPSKFLLNKEIVKSGYKIIISGEGSDEFFIGYPHFKKDLNVGISTSEQKFYKGYQLNDDTYKTLLIEKRLGFIPQWVKTKLLMFKDIEQYIDLPINRKLNEEKFLSNIPENLSNIDTSIYTWSKFALNGYILRTLDDGLSMTNGLESRTPFLDYELIDILNNTDISQLLNFKNEITEKGLLKNISKKYLPEIILNRSKQSFMGDELNITEEMTKSINTYLPMKKMPKDKILLFYLYTLSIFIKKFT